MKSLVYSLTILIVFSVFTIMWMTNFFTQFGRAADPFMPVVWGILLFGFLFEPFMLTDFVANRVRTLTYSNLVVRGIVAGVIICTCWACLYLVRTVVGDYAWILVAAGYGIALIVGAFGIVLFPPSARTGEP